MTDLGEGQSHHSCEKIDSRNRRHVRRVIRIRRREKERRTSAPFLLLTTLLTPFCALRGASIQAAEVAPASPPPSSIDHVAEEHHQGSKEGNPGAPADRRDGFDEK